MPTYDYQCDSCGHQQEFFQKISEEPLVLCPLCEQPALKRGPGGGIGLHFKGSGFYKTDYTPLKENSAPPLSTDQCCPCGKNQQSCSSP